jgi:hypothetical protein
VSLLGEKSASVSHQVPGAKSVVARLALGVAPQPLRIIAPGNGVHLIRDTTLPPGRNTIALQAEVDPSAPEVLWTVDGKPFKLVPYPYSVRWPLQVGEHVIQVSMPFNREVSAPVRIRVE